MKLIISDQQTIAEVKKQFNEAFPYLDLDFFYKQHKPGRPSNFKFLAKNTIKLSDLKIDQLTEEIVITPNMSVNLLEQSFGKRYGLGVQVFRKSGKVWLETTITDTWTLAEQNAEGESLSKGIEPTGTDNYNDRD